MGFKKGVANNPAGRPKGVANKKTIEHTNRAQAMLQAIENDTPLQELVASLSAKDKAVLYVSLLEFTQPRLARQEHTDGDGGPMVITIRHSVQTAPILPAPPAAVEDADFQIIDSTKPF